MEVCWEGECTVKLTVTATLPMQGFGETEELARRDAILHVHETIRKGKSRRGEHLESLLTDVETQSGYVERGSIKGELR